jgi:hypothetical protein
MALLSAIAASRSATSGQTASNLPTACGAGTVTCIRSAPRKRISFPPQHAATAGWRKEKIPIPPITVAVDTRRRRCRKRSRRGHPGLPGLTTPRVSFAAALRTRTEEQSSLSHIRCRWQTPPQWNPRSLRPYPITNRHNTSVSFGP